MHELASAGEAREPLGAVPSGTQMAGFTIEGLLASGSFGSVYRATRDGKLFAIKLVPIGPRGDREVDALRRVQHPNVVGFAGYALWPDEEPRFLVLTMELVEGRPLDVWMEEENPTALELVNQVLIPLARTLAAVHEAGVVHRDVKEANIVMREADGQPVLVDFGAAVHEGAQRLTMRLPPGTPEYRSPEALRFAREWEGEPYEAGPGDDLWAAGIMLYFLLTRALPFGDRHNPAMVRAILEETPPAPHERNPRVPRALGKSCMRLLEKEPEARFVDATEWQQALEEAADGADDGWRVPLFPGGKKEKPPTPAPVHLPPAKREPPPPRWRPWAVGLFLAGVLLLGVLLEGTPRMTSSPHPPTTQHRSGQELDPADMTAEVVPSATPKKSPNPAPMHSEARPMLKSLLKSPKVRSLVAAGCAAGSTACAGGPQLRPPPPADCPPGAAATHKRFGVVWDVHGVSLLPRHEYVDAVPVRDGEAITAEIIGPWGSFPDWTTFDGRLYLGQGRVYGRFTAAHLPGGETVPVCLILMTVGQTERGRELASESTPTRPFVYTSVSVEAVDRFE